jgi:hypothetical protein
MAFLDLLLPTGIDLEWLSAAEFNTDLAQMDNGRESRNQNWDGSLMRGVLHYDARRKADWETVDQMIQVCAGMAHSFKVRDPRKCIATAAEGLFVGGQAVLRTTVGAYSIDKVITKLDPTVTLGSGTVDYATGISPDGAPWWSGIFYLCCRFGADRLELSGVNKEANGNYLAGFKDLPIVEVLGE